MTATCYITFGQKYRNETHPVDDRAHPDGWFEFRADTWVDASNAARTLLGDDGYGRKLPLFARPDHGMYPRGCLARFNVGPDGSVTEATT